MLESASRGVCQVRGGGPPGPGGVVVVSDPGGVVSDPGGGSARCGEGVCQVRGGGYGIPASTEANTLPLPPCGQTHTC